MAQNDVCASHAACMNAVEKQLEILGKGQQELREDMNRLRDDLFARLETFEKSHSADILRVHERIDKIEEASRREDKSIAEKFAKMQSRVSLYIGMAIVWFTILQLMIGAAITVAVKGAFGG